ncbi:MAG: hypothetical protein Q9N34_08865 [Aquificota bacterium]|nr:hypothetical protein [Aquificota bacterium]
MQREFEKVFIGGTKKNTVTISEEVATKIGIDLSNLCRKVKAYGIKLKDLQSL